MFRSNQMDEKWDALQRCAAAGHLGLVGVLATELRRMVTSAGFGGFKAQDGEIVTVAYLDEIVASCCQPRPCQGCGQEEPWRI